MFSSHSAIWITKTTVYIHTNPPLPCDPIVITDPCLPIPQHLTKKQRQYVRDLREVWAATMQQRLDNQDLSTPHLVFRLIEPMMAGLYVEQLIVLPCNARIKLKGEVLTVSRGDIDGTDAAPRMVLRAVLQAGASSFIIAHNHPTGDPQPSAGDLAVTRVIVAAGKAVGCPLNDHIVCGKNGTFTSLRNMHPEIFK